MSRLLIWRYRGLNVGDDEAPGEASFEDVTFEPQVGRAAKEFPLGIRQNAAWTAFEHIFFNTSTPYLMSYIKHKIAIDTAQHNS
jgi:hypothetical protein